MAAAKLEAFVGQPPTSQCQQVIGVMEQIVRHHPGQVRLVIFARGAPWTETPSPGLRSLFYKGSVVPACFVAGEMVVQGRVPTLEELETKVREVLGADQGLGRCGQSSR